MTAASIYGSPPKLLCGGKSARRTRFPWGETGVLGEARGILAQSHDEPALQVSDFCSPPSRNPLPAILTARAARNQIVQPSASSRMPGLHRVQLRLDRGARQHDGATAGSWLQPVQLGIAECADFVVPISQSQDMVEECLWLARWGDGFRGLPIPSGRSPDRRGCRIDRDVGLGTGEIAPDMMQPFFDVKRCRIRILAEKNTTNRCFKCRGRV